MVVRKHEEEPEGDRRHDEEVGGHDLACVIGQNVCQAWDGGCCSSRTDRGGCPAAFAVTVTERSMRGEVGRSIGPQLRAPQESGVWAADIHT
jgi:hypothetical protein